MWWEKKRPAMPQFCLRSAMTLANEFPVIGNNKLQCAVALVWRYVQDTFLKNRTFEFFFASRR